ncbi:GNAT family N-acetyltransferase [Psychromicrobium lacuslunae]|uniref:N-acetyltransferase domain-containing protein n=1 Tax=Psychromicrobium lacuslunae TaxID=1618207 RepID=A0A0D4BWB8_9MICC|nr:N-acetyltransferase [Psychromicrobium lacuslunae]AJT40594.1 hypothetical protein UM93_01870 [Psychromicrobium lacuslunae]
MSFSSKTNTNISIRHYSPSDEPSWLRCRVLSFLGSSYFDDVKTAKTSFVNPALELVAVDTQTGSQVLGLLDLEIFTELATIDTIAVHPDYARHGIATALWQRAIELLPDSVQEIDAWTREDEPANRWYRQQGFEVDTEYLHVYYQGEAAGERISTPPGLRLRAGFLHAELHHEPQLREEFNRVHHCRRYLRRSF